MIPMFESRSNINFQNEVLIKEEKESNDRLC